MHPSSQLKFSATQLTQPGFYSAGATDLFNLRQPF